MAQRLILEISDQSFRVSVASQAGRRALISDHFAVAIPSDATPEQMADLLKSALATHRVNRGDCDVVVTRRAVEMRELTVPPVPSEELPDLLRFSARNEFASMNDSWRLDFVPLSDDASQSRRVLAAALSPQVFEDTNQLLTRCGLKLKRLLLRPFCLAAALDGQKQNEAARLLVAVVDRTAEMVLVHGGRVHLSRSVLLSGDPAGPQLNELKTELQRTLVMASRALPDHEPVVVAAGWGASAEQLAQIAEQVQRQITKYAAESNRSVECSGKCQSAMNSGELLAAIGAVSTLDSKGDAWTGIDFASPRRRIEKKRDWRQLALWGGLAAALIVTLAGIAWWLVNDQTQTITRLRGELETLKKNNETQGNRPGVDQIVGEVTEIDEWQRGQIDWLEELNELSNRMYTADETMVDSLTADYRNGEVVIALKGHVKNVAVGSDLKSSLVKRPYMFTEGPTREDAKASDYPWSYEYALRRQVSDLDVAGMINDRVRALRDTPATTADPTSPETPAAAEPLEK